MELEIKVKKQNPIDVRVLGWFWDNPGDVGYGLKLATELDISIGRIYGALDRLARDGHIEIIPTGPIKNSGRRRDYRLKTRESASEA